MNNQLLTRASFKGKNINHQGMINARIEGINEGVRSMYFSVS